MPGLLEKRVVEWRSQGRRLAAVDAALLIGGAALSALAALVWADHLLVLPRGVRIFAWGAGVGSLSAAVWRRLIAPLRSLDARAALAAVSKRHPAARPYLVPAWELGRGRPDPATSEELARAHVASTERLLEELGGVRAYDAPPSSRAARAAAAGALALVTLIPLRSSRAWPRVLAPWSAVPLERFLTVEPGDAALETGRPATITARWTRESPIARERGVLRLSVRSAEGWRPTPLDRLEDASASFTLASLAEPFVYRFEWRDIRTRAYTLRPTLPPRLESLRARVHGAQAEHVALSAAEPLTVLRGAFVTIGGTPNQPLAKAALKLSSQPGPIAFKALPSGEYEAGFTASEDATFQLELETPDGRKDLEPALYRIVAKADEPPKVELVSPLEPVQASPQDALPIAYSVRDDGGVAKISLVVRAKGRPSFELPLGSGGGRRDVVGEYAWELSGLPRGRAEFQVKAVDAGGRAGFSQTGVVELVDFEGAHQKMETGWLQAQERLKALAAREDAAKALAQAGKGEELSKQEAALAEEWRKAASDYDALASQMADDAYANPGLAEQAKAMSEELSRAAKEDVAQAAKATRAGDFPRAAKAHERLAQRARMAERGLDEGRKVQALQDFYTHSGRMSQTAEQLKSALEAAANAGKATPEERARLDAALGKLQKQLSDLQKVLDSLPKAEPNSEDARGRQQVAVPLGAAKQAADELQKALASGDMAAAARAAQRLSEQLAQIQQRIGEAAAAAASSSPARQASARAERVEALWSEAVEQQTSSLESVQRIEDERLQKKVAADKDLVEAAAREQRALADEAQAMGARPEAVTAMREAADDLAGGKPRRAPELMKTASALLRSPVPVPAQREALAVREDALRKKLEEGASAPPAPAERAAQAGALQRQARAKTEQLGKELDALDAETPVPPSVGRSISDAQDYQKRAEEQLAAGDTEGAAESQQEALRLLSEGSQKMSSSAGAQKSAADGMAEPFSRPAGGLRKAGNAPRGSRGAGMGFVPLPSSREYKPPKELREELERSLQESRPPAHDPLIKEYFKRISQ